MPVQRRHTRRPSHVVDCQGCGTEMVLGEPHAPPVLCTDCTEKE